MNTMTKRIMCTLLTFVMILSLGACSKDIPSNNPKETQATNSPKQSEPIHTEPENNPGIEETDDWKTTLPHAKIELYGKKGENCTISFVFPEGYTWKQAIDNDTYDLIVMAKEGCEFAGQQFNLYYQYYDYPQGFPSQSERIEFSLDEPIGTITEIIYPDLLGDRYIMGFFSPGVRISFGNDGNDGYRNLELEFITEKYNGGRRESTQYFFAEIVDNRTE